MSDAVPDDAGSQWSSLRVPIAFLAVAAWLATIAWLASHVSPRVKLLLIFPIAVGLAGGYGIGVLCWWAGLRRRAAAGAIALPFVAVMLGAYFWFSFLVWQSREASFVETNLRAQPGGAAILEQVRSNQPAANEIEAELLAFYRDRLHPPLKRYLQERIRLPKLPKRLAPPWPLLFAVVECLAGAVAGSWMAMKVNDENSRGESAEQKGNSPGETP